MSGMVISLDEFPGTPVAKKKKKRKKKSKTTTDGTAQEVVESVVAHVDKAPLAQPKAKTEVNDTELEIKVEIPQQDEESGQAEQPGPLNTDVKSDVKSESEYPKFNYEDTSKEEVDPDAEWYSKHRYYANGLCVRGPVAEDIPFDLFYVVCGVFMFFLILSSTLGFFFLGDTAPLLVGASMAWIVTAWAAFVITSLTEPGVVPGQSHNEYLAEMERKQVKLEQLGPDYKFCEKCNLVSRRDDYIFHCYECHACVAELDHHCGVTGTCIGARNKVHFFMIAAFVPYAMFYLASLFAITLTSFFIDSGTESAENLEFAAFVIAMVSFGQLALFDFFWFAAYFGWLQVKSCFGLCLNPLYYFHLLCCESSWKRRPYSRWTSQVERSPACCGSSLCTVPTRKLYPPENGVRTGCYVCVSKY